VQWDGVRDRLMAAAGHAEKQGIKILVLDL
jgi:hypothetical protein